MNLRLADWRGSFEEIEVAPAIGLRDVAGVQVPEATRVGNLARLPPGTAARQLIVGDAERETTSGHVELDGVAVPDECQRTAGE